MEETMQELARHEIFEIKVLEELKNNGFLNGLVFGGGTMLRLCHQLKRYSVDLDFWFLKKIDAKSFLKEMKSYLQSQYRLTDCAEKHFTLVFEIKGKESLRKLKIEVRKEISQYQCEDQIAFSPFSTQQVLLKCFTLEQMMQNKIEALLDRHEIRDAFDLEFLLRKGIAFPAKRQQLQKIKEVVQSFTKQDYKAKLGSLLPADLRAYYAKNHFSFLLENLGD